MQILDGKKVAAGIKNQLKRSVEAFKQSTGRPPGLTVILVGDDPASEVYVRNKDKACEAIGMKSELIKLPAETSQEELTQKIQGLNADDSVDGILVQLPLPSHLDSEKALEAIDPTKDPDGLTQTNMGLLWAGKPRVASCTPQGVMSLLKVYEIPIEGQHAVVIGRSNIVGKPMAQLLNMANATVTICHSRTKDLEKHTKLADILVVAAGKPRFLGKEAIKEGAVVIDVGIHRQMDEDGKPKLCGDVRFEELEGIASAATPVPGGVGPLTIATLLENTVRLAELREGSVSSLNLP